MPFLLILSIIAIVLNNLLPQKRTVLHPQTGNINNLYGFIDPKTGQNSKWIDEKHHEWFCSFKSEHPLGCGSNVGWGTPANEGIDLSNYEKLKFDIEYKGTSRRLRMAMHNYNEVYSDINDAGTNKHLSVLIKPMEIDNNSITFDLSEFRVSKWWVKDRRMHRRWTSPEIDNITSIGVEVVELSDNHIKLNRIIAIGHWINPQTLLYLVVISWMIFFLLQGFIQLYLVYTGSMRNRKKLFDLLKQQQALESENQYLSDIAKLDPLTGILNRNGFLDKLTHIAPKMVSTNNNLAFLIIDLDHFKSINDRYGHDFGDSVIKHFSHSVSSTLRKTDIFARWGGEEFILICEFPDTTNLREFSENIGSTPGKTPIDSKPGFTYTVSIGVSRFSAGEHFENVFKRADNALYQAKQDGRDRVEYDL